MDRFFGPVDDGVFESLTGEMVDDFLEGGERDVSELLMLYFACVSADPEEVDFGDGPERIVEMLSDMADDGDEDALMAMVAVETLETESATDEAVIVGAAMMQAVASRPILRNIISGDMDYDAAVPALMVIKMLADHLVSDVVGDDDFDLDDIDLDDFDFDAFGESLGFPASDDDFDGEFNDR